MKEDVPAFTATDLRVYAAVRRLKKARVLELARETKLAKSTVQGALARLQGHKLVTRTIIHGVPIIRARSASNLIRSLEAHRKRLAEQHASQNKLLLQAVRGLKHASLPQRPTKAKPRGKRRR